MASALDAGTELRSRYTIKKVLDSGEDGAVYAVREGKTPRVIKEMLTTAVPPDVLPARRKAYEEALESVMAFEHEDLVRIVERFSEADREYLVMELVEGFNLETIVEMSVNALPDKQVVDWALQLCDTMAYLHGRPRPFLFVGASPRKVMVLPSGRLKIVNLGIDRYFERELQHGLFAETERDRLLDYVRFGELLYFMAARKPLPADGLPERPATGITEALYQVIRRCLGQEMNQVYKSWADVSKQLDEVLHPPETAEERTPEPPSGKLTMSSAGVPLLPWQEAIVGAVNRILSQALPLLALEGLGVVAALVAVYLWLNPGLTFKKNGPMAYVISGDGTMVVMSPSTGKVLDRREFHDAIISSVRAGQNGSRLLALDAHNDRVYSIDTASNETREQFSVAAGPVQLTVASDQKTAYCLHPRTHNVSQIDVPSFRLTNIFTVPSAPQSLAVSPDGMTLYVTVSHPDSLVVMDADSGKVQDTIPLPSGAGPVAVTQDGKEVWVAATMTNTLQCFDATVHPANPIITLNDVGGKAPIRMLSTPDGLYMDILCRESASIAVIKVQDHSLQTAISLGGSNPAEWSLSPAPTRLWVVEPDANTVVQVDPASNTVTQTITAVHKPTAVEVSP